MQPGGSAPNGAYRCRHMRKAWKNASREAASEPCLSGYAVIEGGRIIGGAGVIENDYHDRKDLSPNLCALYVEEEYRRRGIAGRILDLAAADMKTFGIDKLYLITDHTSFYERYGWNFLCMVQPDGEPEMIRMYVKEL